MSVFVEDVMSVRAAAQLLGVTEKQVQHLGRRGEVTYVARGLLDASSVRALQAARQGTHSRGWSGDTAWAAIALLTGNGAAWLGQVQASRLRARLRGIDSAGLVAATRNRAVVHRFTAHEAAADRLTRESSTVARRSLPGLVGDQHHQTDWYVDSRDENHLVRAHSLSPDPRGRFVLRAVKTEGRSDSDGVSLGLVAATMRDADVLVALDSYVSDDPRERGVAAGLLDDALNRFRRDA